MVFSETVFFNGIFLSMLEKQFSLLIIDVQTRILKQGEVFVNII